MQEIISLIGILVPLIVAIFQKPPPTPTPTLTKPNIIYIVVVIDDSQHILSENPSVTEKT